MIKIQSISDIITNSSSEVFCIIESKDHLDLIEEILSPLFPFNPCSEEDPELIRRFKEDYYDSKEEFPEEWLEIVLPYHMEGVKSFYKEGLKAVLDTAIPNQNYKINYNIEF